MKLFAFRGDEPNFGDELNHWLMPKVFPEMFDEDERTIFLAIGSTIYDHHSKESVKIVFGTGYGGYTAPPKIDDKWKFFCVRGPRTAQALGLGPEFVAGDAAILINGYRNPRRKDASQLSFMPHFESIKRGHWKLACRLAGVTYIDPRDDVEHVLQQIESSRLLITEAMHGAIVADALRVPWIAVLPVDQSHWMKWQDWAGALDMEVSFNRLSPSSGREAYLRMRGTKYPRPSVRLALKAFDIWFVLAAAYGLRSAARRKTSLSSDAALRTAIQRLQSHAAKIRSAFGSPLRVAQ